jgi:hypothetical protein
MKAFVSWAHRGEGWSDTLADAWQETVEAFADLLDDAPDVDVALDLGHENDPDLDWGRWGLRQIETSDFVLIAMNEPWAQRWRGDNDPTVGGGAVAEADALRGLFTKDQSEFQRRVRVVMLPGSYDRDIPLDLYRLKRATVTELSPDGVSKLLDDLRSVPTHVRRPKAPAQAALVRAPSPLILDDDSLLLFRFRDLPRPTIKNHRSVLENNPAGYVWWGWWKKYHENAQVELWEALRRHMGGGPVRVGLFDSGSPTGDVRRATVSKVLVPRLDEFDDCQPFYPDPEEWPYIPSYYGPSEDQEPTSCAWLCLTGIESRPFPFFGRYEFVSNDLAFNGVVVRDLKQLTGQHQSLWHLRKTSA